VKVGQALRGRIIWTDERRSNNDSEKKIAKQRGKRENCCPRSNVKLGYSITVKGENF